MKTTLGRIFYKIAYKIIYFGWFLTKPNLYGVQLVLRKDNKILFIQHTYMHKGFWDFPGGGMKEDEKPEETMDREIKEELEVALEKITQIGQCDIYQNLHHDHVTIFEGITKEENISFNRAEIDKVEWFPVNEIPGNLSPLTRKVWETYLNSLS